MNIVASQVDLAHSTYEFYFSGCNFQCKGCQNSELWNFNQGIPWKDFLKEHDTWNKIREAGSVIKRIALLGGEPLHQDHKELEEFLQEMENELPEHEKMLFTGFEMSEIPQHLRMFFDYFKCGPYKEELAGENIQEGYDLATTNQYICINVECCTESQCKRRLKLVWKHWPTHSTL